MTLTLTHFNEYRPTAKGHRPLSVKEKETHRGLGVVTRDNNLYTLLHPLSQLFAHTYSFSAQVWCS